VRTGLEREHRRGTRRLQVGAVTPRQASRAKIQFRAADFAKVIRLIREHSGSAGSESVLLSLRGDPASASDPQGNVPRRRDERLANPEERARGNAATRPCPDARMNSARANGLLDLTLRLPEILSISSTQAQIPSPMFSNSKDLMEDSPLDSGPVRTSLIYIPCPSALKM